jgi:membrane protease YdiL (CAAX protease family)
LAAAGDSRQGLTAALTWLLRLKRKLSAYLSFWLTGFAILIAAFFLFKNVAKKIAGDTLLIYATVFVAVTLAQSLSHEAGSSKVVPLIDADRAELYLRFGRAVISLEKFLPSASYKDTHIKAVEDRYAEFLLEAHKILAKAASKAPNSAVLKARLIIVLHELKKNCDDRLDDLSKTKSQNGKELYRLLSSLYGKKPISPALANELKEIIGRSFSHGWYREATLLELYKSSGQTDSYYQLKQTVDGRSLHLMGRLVLVMVIAVLLFFAGLIVIIVQLFFLPREITPASELPLIATAGSWNLKTVYSVLIAWQTTQLLVGLIGLGAQSSVKTMTILSWGVLPAALGTATLYLMSNGPALLYMYYFAFKPHGVRFAEGIKWRSRVGSLGPVQLVLAGVLTWLAAIPIVVLSFLVAAKFLGSQGSTNPIIALVMEVARSSNWPATAIFYLTLGVLAPLCEESLFRGFLYCSLRKNLNIPISILISGTLFAAVHLDVGGFLVLACLGCLFAFVLERTKSILPSLVAHGLWNSGTFSLVLLLFQD